MREIKCPNCGAVIRSDITGREFLYCEYCGTKIDLMDHRSHIIIEDKAKIREAEAQEKIKLKELDSKNTSHVLRNWMLTLLGCVICIIIGAFFTPDEPLFSLRLIGLLALMIALPGGFVIYLIDLFRHRRR